MDDPILGPLKPDPHVSGCMLASIPYQGRKIDLRVDPDDLEMEGCLNLARDFVVSLKELEAKARLVAAEKLLDEYNEDWRMFSRARTDGSMEDVTDPLLTSTEFSQRLELVAIAVTGLMVEFCFGDSGLFSGHSIFVTSFDGTAFTDTHAKLFG